MENNVPKVSVIIPVYNTENYLRKCLDSVCNQTLKDIEIICINDCSTDSSLELLRGYASKDSRIKIIDFKENKGAAVARNTGIDEAQGEYLGFIDSDDYVDINFYENLYKKAYETRSEVIKGSDMIIVHTDGTKEVDKQNERIKKNKINFWSQYTTAIYQREFILKNNIRFPIGLLVGEDPVFAIKCAFLSNKIDIINNAQYYYIRRDGSLDSENWDDKKIDSYIKYIEIITDFASGFKLNYSDYKHFTGWILHSIETTRLIKASNNQKNYKILTEFFTKIRQKLFKYPIKILFDANVLYISEKRGIYWVSYNLLKKFLNDKRFEVTLWLDRNFACINPDPLYNDLRPVFSNIHLGKIANYKVLENKHFNASEYDVYFNPAINGQLSVGLKPQSFYMLYDTIPMMDKDWFAPEYSKEFKNFYDKLTKDTYCFCDSQSCKNDFIKYFKNLDEDKMSVALISTALNLYPQRDKKKLDVILKKYNAQIPEGSKYILYFGAPHDPRKNVLFSIKCFINFIRQNDIQDLYFILGGARKDILLEMLKSYAGKNYESCKKHIIVLEYVDKEDVNILYSNSLFFSFLSLYEGFGMPPLEAMQAGVPVICANNSSLPEVVGDAAIMVDAEDEEEIIAAFAKFYFNEELRNEYIKRGLARAKLFSWEKTYEIISNRIINVLTNDEK